MTDTNEAGLFSEQLLQPGLYNVTVAKAGFENVVENVQLVVDQRADLKITMTVGAVSQTVTVTEAAPDLQTQTASLGTVIENKEIDELPETAGSIPNCCNWCPARRRSAYLNPALHNSARTDPTSRPP